MSGSLLERRGFAARSAAALLFRHSARRAAAADRVRRAGAAPAGALVGAFQRYTSEISQSRPRSNPNAAPERINGRDNGFRSQLASASEDTIHFSRLWFPPSRRSAKEVSLAANCVYIPRESALGDLRALERKRSARRRWKCTRLESMEVVIILGVFAIDTSS